MLYADIGSLGQLFLGKVVVPSEFLKPTGEAEADIVHTPIVTKHRILDHHTCVVL